ncbi:MAG: hypothetical protein LBR51_05695 [Bacteroidales bacterium]|jgi:tetratricopeptide (TPR) repeat protein|nr:hypothetical protein [Bacteroidales bacterium]
MRKLLYPLYLLFLSGLFSCQQTTPLNQRNLEELSVCQKKMVHNFHILDSMQLLGQFDPNKSDDFIEDVLSFYNKYPEEQITPALLDNAALVSMSLAMYYKDMHPEDGKLKTKYAKQALNIFNKILKVYPDYSRSALIAYQKGVIYDNILEDYAKAETEYRKFIHKKPHDSLAINISNYLPYIGKSTKEIMDSIHVQQMHQDTGH